MAKATKRGKSKSSGEKTSNRDLYQAVTDRIIAALEAGTVPWRQPWKNGATQSSNPLAPRNAATGRAYNGINAMLLATSPLAFGDNRWLTFNPAREAGGCVRKGEHGELVVFWKFLEIESEDKNGNATQKSIPFLRGFTVFNVRQCDGLDEAKLKNGSALPSTVAEDEGEAFDPLASCEAVVQGYSDAPLIRHEGNRAFYTPTLDAIGMPKREQFASAEQYYGTLFHEMTHSTGHTDRLNRHKGNAEWGHFGSEIYSQEELVAEIGAAFLQKTKPKEGFPIEDRKEVKWKN